MNPKQSLEKAAHNYIAGLETPLTSVTNIYKGFENSLVIDGDENNVQPQTKDIPCIKLIAEGNHAEEIYNTGIYRGTLAVVVEQDAKDITDADFNTLCADVFSRFNIVQLAANMSSRTANFYCLQMRKLDQSHSITEGGNWEAAVRFDVVYALADL